MNSKKMVLKQIKKFFFEFLIVTFGILTAFSINKWDENRKQNAEEISSYKSLKQDLKSDLYVLNYHKDKMEAGVNYLQPIYEKNYSSIDSIEAYLNNSFDLQEGNATYINLKYSGKLEILRADTIKRLLTLYYETYYQGLETISESHREFVAYNITPYLIDNMDYDSFPDPKDVRELLKDNKLRNLVKYQLSMFMSNISILEKSENLINRIIARINKELKVNE